MKNIIMAGGALMFAGVLSGCTDLATTKVSYCYALTEDPSVNIVITPQGEEFFNVDGTTTLYDTVRIVDSIGEEKTIGEIRNGSFYYGDGSRWEFSEQGARGFGGLVEGVVATKTNCP